MRESCSFIFDYYKREPIILGLTGKTGSGCTYVLASSRRDGLDRCVVFAAHAA